jgi:hypothetical protein
LPSDLIREALSAAPHSKIPLLSQAAVSALSEVDLRCEFEKFMIANKGSAQMHEWLLAELDDQTLPPTLKTIVDRASRPSSASEIGTMTLL